MTDDARRSNRPLIDRSSIEVLLCSMSPGHLHGLVAEIEAHVEKQQTEFTRGVIGLRDSDTAGF